MFTGLTSIWAAPFLLQDHLHRFCSYWHKIDEWEVTLQGAHVLVQFPSNRQADHIQEIGHILWQLRLKPHHLP